MTAREETIKQYNELRAKKQEAFEKLAAAREKVDMVAKPTPADIAAYEAAQKAYKELQDKMEEVKTGFWS